MRATLLLLLLVGCVTLLLTAQSPVPSHQIQPLQVKACLRPTAVCQFDNPVTPGSLLIAASIGSCISTGCLNISDSNANVWQPALVLQYYNGQALDYVLNAKGGYTSVYFTAWPAGDWAAIIAEYPPSTGLEDANDGYYGPQNLHPNGALGGSDIEYARPVETHEPCELLVSWSNSGSYDLAHFQDSRLQPIAGPNFTVRAHEYGWLALEDSTTTTLGLYIGTIGWTDYGHWMEGVAAFKMGGCK
jgi:hypothetical protein